MARPRSDACVEVTIRLAASLRPLAGGRRMVSARGRTVGEVLGALEARHPALRPRLRQGDGGLRHSVLIFLNSQDIRSREGEDTPCQEGDELTIVPAIEGG